MAPDAIEEAVRLFIAARRSGERIDRLPERCKPANVDEAHAIQAATVAALGESVAGWKVGSVLEGTLIRGVLLASRVYADGATIPAASVPLLGVEAEIAFRFERDLPPRERAYSDAEVADAVIAFPAIEIVDSRFRDYAGTPLLDRVADCVSNGAFVHAAPQPRWRGIDLVGIEVTLRVDGSEVDRRHGGHPAGDPLRPAIDLVNALRTAEGVRAGQMMTTGTYTPIRFVKPGQAVSAVFTGFGSAGVRFGR